MRIVASSKAQFLPSNSSSRPPSGQLQPSDLVWKDGMGQWIEARKIKGLFLVKAKPVPASGPTLPDDLAWIESASQSSTTHPTRPATPEPWLDEGSRAGCTSGV